MKTTDFNNTYTAEHLNESMFKQFGKKINFENYNREQLENYRNLLRTKVNQNECNSKFNDLIANENYQQDKLMLELLNTKIKELIGESTVIIEKSKSKKQARLMAMAAHDPAIAKKSRIKQSVAKEFNKADTGTKLLSKAMKTKTESIKPLKGNQKKLDVADPKGKLDKADFKSLRKNAEKLKESAMAANYKIIIESLQTLLAEDEEGKAKDITAGTDMVNDFTSWMQRVGQYQTKTMIELADNIRANFGQEKSDRFKNTLQPALQSALDALTASRETITHAVAVLAGEPGAEEAEMMGSTPVPNEEVPSTELDTNADEFAASDAAAGGAEIAGRAMRESFEEQSVRRLQESHNVIWNLAK